MKNKIKIEKLNHQAKGIGYFNNKIHFISNALPEETVEFQILKETSKIVEGISTKILNNSRKRIEAKCPYYNQCGGCHLGHISYIDEVSFKNNKICEILTKYANVDKNLINKIIPNNKEYNYRNKITLKIKGKKLGYYKELTNDFIEINKCILCDDIINEKIKKLNIESLNKQETIIKSFDNKIFLDKYIYNVDTNSFFQINEYQTINIYNKIKEYIKIFNKPNVLDLYCGVGSIGIYISEYANKVCGIEINKNAIKNAKENAKINNIANIDFILSDVDKIIDKLNFKPDVIIVDPPRNGLSKITLNQILRINPKYLIYLSCNPMTLARDLNMLKENFFIENIQPYDMFPRTYHIECLTLLYRK